MLPNIPVIGQQPLSELKTTQFVIPAGVGATFAASNNIATITFNAAHGLTFTPAAGILPNYFIGFGGSSSGMSGTGVLVGNIFRILSIPSATAITIYTTITAATITSLTGLPVFFPDFQVAPYPGTGNSPSLAECDAYFNLGANANLYYNPDRTLIALDANTTQQLGGTPATAPTIRKLIAASSQGEAAGAYPYLFLQADGTTATSYVSVLQ